MTGTQQRPARSVWTVWAILAGASVAGFLLADGLAPAAVATTAAVLLAALKIRLVFDHYMEIGWNHKPLRQLLAAWLVLVSTILLATYWMS
jgi:hypothetical protein